MANWVYDDGGRAAAGFKGKTGDCGVRAVAIATGQNYQTVYDALWEANRTFAQGRSRKARVTAKNPSPRDGIFVEALRPYMESLGWVWVPTMAIGQGCTVHLRRDELPPGRIIARVTKHFCAVVDGIIHDTYDPSRDGTRCVYGYFIQKVVEV